MSTYKGMFYNPTTEQESSYRSFPTYVDMPGGGVKQKNALTLDEWAALGWYPFTAETAPDGQQPVLPWSYDNNGDGTYTKRPASYEPIPEPEPVPRYILLPLEFQARFTTAEKRAIDAAAEANDGIYEIKSAFRAAVEIDLQSSLTQEAMAVLVAAGIMTQERADKLLGLIP